MPKACSDRHPQTADAGEMRRHGRLRTSVLSGGKKQSGADGTDAEVHRGMCGVRGRTEEKRLLNGFHDVLKLIKGVDTRGFTLYGLIHEEVQILTS